MMGRYGGSNCGKCGGSHSGFCPSYGDEEEEHNDEELSRRVQEIKRYISKRCPSVFSDEQGAKLVWAIITARNDMIEAGNSHPELLDFLLYFVAKGVLEGD